MSILHQQLLECIREVESIRQCKDLASQLTIRLEEEEQHLKKWEARIPKEQRDVDILEGEGITSLITKFIGNRENKIEEEKDEYLRASRHYMDIYNSIELLRFELDILKKKEETLKIVENRLVSLMKEREKELILSDPKIAELINKINNDSNLLMTPIKNIGNLIKSGEEIIDNLVIIGQNLIEASGYYLNKDKDYWPLMY